MKVKAIWEALKQGILLCDSEARIVYFNNSYARFIGKSLEEVRGMPIKDVRSGAVAPQVIAEGKSVESVLRVEHGQEYFTDVYPVVEEGQITGSVSVVTSINDANCIKEKMLQLEKQEQLLRDRMAKTNGTHYSFDNIICRSPKTLETIARARKAAVHPVNILLQGESGCGKELFAQSIHNESQRHSGPFVAVNCAALGKTMLESELFGYEDGAFTGAKKGGKPGLFEMARGGTLFLDEISEMDYELQAKLLRVLQENRFRRIGGLKEIETDVRIICACNVDLLKYIEEKKFRMDLYYRIAVFPLTIPPLRERREDILELVDYYLQQVQIQNKKQYYMTEEVRQLMYRYDWPGNIRELRNVIEYCALMAVSQEINCGCLPPSLLSDKLHHATETLTLEQRLRNFERNEILTALHYYGDDTEGKKRAAKALGISLSSLYNKLNAGYTVQK